MTVKGLLGRLEESDSAAIVAKTVVLVITGCPDVPGVSVGIGTVDLLELRSVRVVLERSVVLRVRVVLEGPDMLRVSVAGPDESVLPGAGEVGELLGRLEGSDSALIDLVVVRGITGCSDVPEVSVGIGIVALLELRSVRVVLERSVVLRVRVVLEGPDMLRVSVAGPAARELSGSSELEEGLKILRM